MSQFSNGVGRLPARPGGGDFGGAAFTHNVGHDFGGSTSEADCGVDYGAEPAPDDPWAYIGGYVGEFGYSGELDETEFPPKRRLR